MNKWRIYVAGIILEVEGRGDYGTLRKTGLFKNIEQVGYFQTFDTDDMWIYEAELNGKMETVVIKRVEQEKKCTVVEVLRGWKIDTKPRKSQFEITEKGDFQEVLIKTLKQFNAGKTVLIKGEEWVILQHLDNGGTFCLKQELLQECMPFDKNNCNDWKKSSLREYLNKEYIKQLENGLKAEDGKEIILDTVQDLTADDGTEEYGSSTDKVFLLTCEQYRKYRKLFKKIPDWWWLITANSTIISCYVRDVSTDGSLSDYYACNGSYGVRPACVFNHSIIVEK